MLLVSSLILLLTLICPALLGQAAKAVLSQLKRMARALWSNPPTHGARIAAEVVGDPDMFELWKAEVGWQLLLLLTCRFHLPGRPHSFHLQK
jgi:aspartate/tyrosine/aromatic aminotransferase